jgi:hypothetical protein
MVFSVDGRVHYTYEPPVKNPSTWPFNADQYLLLNIAIQPNILPAFTESAMVVDYVRVYQLNTTSVAEVARPQGLKVYPNPTREQLHIELPVLSDRPIAVQLYNAQGQLLRSEQHLVSEPLLQLEALGSLPAGLYIVQLQADGRSYVARFSKE